MNASKNRSVANLNSICPLFLLNDTNSAVLMECNYFNPIKCRLSFRSGAVVFQENTNMLIMEERIMMKMMTQPWLTIKRYEHIQKECECG